MIIYINMDMLKIIHIIVDVCILYIINAIYKSNWLKRPRISIFDE